jgi:hypothetical protein
MAPLIDPQSIRDALDCDARCLEYRVTNYYLDGATGEFSSVIMGSPRLRFRLYESGPYRFGHLERKRQLTPASTAKEVWPACDVWALLTDVLPWLRGLTLLEPTLEAPLSVLLSDGAGGDFDLPSLRCVGSLAYRRLSCALTNARVTADWDFEPSIVATGTMIVETKCEADASPPETLRRLQLRPLATSKYALLQAVAA